MKIRHKSGNLKDGTKLDKRVSSGAIKIGDGKVSTGAICIDSDYIIYE